MLDATIQAYATRIGAALIVAACLAVPLAITNRHDARSAPGTSASVRGIAHVIDGDTIAVRETHIRLEGIDAPEASQHCGRKWLGTWACGRAATKALTALVEGREVDCASKGKDKYDRVLGICRVAGLDVNAEMVRRGLAWAFVKYSSTYVSEEADAKARRVGVWQGEAQSAWDYRARRWTSVETTAPRGCVIKGNITRNGHIYHMPWSAWYDKVTISADKGERWFCSEAEALEAGWRRAH